MAYKTLSDLPVKSTTRPDAAPAFRPIQVGPVKFPEGAPPFEPVEGRTLPSGFFPEGFTIPDSGFTSTLPEWTDPGFTLTAPERPNLDPGFTPTSPGSTILFPENHPPLIGEDIKILTPEERVKDMLERGVESMTDEEFEAMLADEKFKEAFPQAYEYINSEDYEIMTKSLDNLQSHYAPTDAIEGQKTAIRQAVLGEMTKDLETALETGKETPEESNDTVPQDTTETSEPENIEERIKNYIEEHEREIQSPLDQLNLPDAMKEIISDHVEPSLPESKFEKARIEKFSEAIREKESAHGMAVNMDREANSRTSRGSEFDDIVQDGPSSPSDGIGLDC